MSRVVRWFLPILLVALLPFQASLTSAPQESRNPFLVVLGIAQDGGVPQAGTRADQIDTTLRRLVVCLALIDPESGERWLFEATPDFREQLRRLDQIAPDESVPGLDGIFLTHAHMGHYAGFLFLGHESMGAVGVPVYAMGGMHDFLKSSGPWEQLVRYRNIVLRDLTPGYPVRLNNRLQVTPIPVPHRQEYSEVVGFRIDGPDRSALFIPDIDSWDDWDRDGTRVEDLIEGVDLAYLDGTFYHDGELPGRDMKTFPHPFITTSMDRFGRLDSVEREKIRFIHLNHSNPALRSDSPEYRSVQLNGFRVAEEGERVGL